MRRFWYVLGIITGALVVWMLTRDDRELAAEERAHQERIAEYAKESERELAMLGAIHGEDYLSDEYWEQELAQYQDDEE